jgi:hypothetical protein
MIFSVGRDELLVGVRILANARKAQRRATQPTEGADGQLCSVEKVWEFSFPFRGAPDRSRTSYTARKVFVAQFVKAGLLNLLY